MSALHPAIEAVTQRIRERSRPTRTAYLDLIARAREAGVQRARLSCGNLAHAFAASGEDKAALKGEAAINIAIVNSYNDMLSAHQPLGRYPEQIKIFAREIGATAQLAGGVPAMCDGVTQGQTGMELSLFSRDVIALSTAVSLSHDMFDAALMLGVCDKIVPGLLMGALRFGHLPMLFVPAGPMPSGLPNKEKARVRQLYAEGKASRAELLEAESQSYHSPGTCTFYGTANSNQMLMEVMGLHVPGSAFVNPGTPMRTALTRAAVHRVAKHTASSQHYRPIGLCVDERAIVNAIVGLLATGGSTNHAIHLPAIARAAGILVDWADFDALSKVTPLMARIYPNGQADVNHFHAAGGMGFIVRELIEAGLLHKDLAAIGGSDLSAFAQEPQLGADGEIHWKDAPSASLDEAILRGASAAFQAEGGLCLVKGNLGRGCFKTSAVEESRWTIEAPARVFDSQDGVLAAFKRGELGRDGVVVLTGQGPRANGMPELHKLTPALGVLQDRGFKVALVTDGRMSGASGKVPAAIHLSPEAYGGGPIAKVRDGDVIRLCARRGEISALVPDTEWAARAPNVVAQDRSRFGLGRELFAMMRKGCGDAESGASVMLDEMGEA